MDRWIGKTAVVTGAASGIGASIGRSLLLAGVNVVGLDVQIERLQRQAVEHQKLRIGDSKLGNMYAVKCDVSREQDISKAFDWIELNVGCPHILVNNAGVTDYTPLVESDRASFERLININVLGVANCTSKAVQSMRNHKVEGHIFNINSILGHEVPEGVFSEQAGANGWSLYPASKHATVAMTHTVRREISRLSLPIRITSISPGIVRTEITKCNEALSDLFDKVRALEPSDIADALLYALGTPPKVQITEMTVRSTGEL
ncbi:farnesol dehydrogenase-like [Copidosoma floridanum]|uniref:farnesol dehydrogenase-like n=1 Tax=Copidosoma floridanum TaxID=29053 RepID=UPI0006C970B8|nr:farnesol dehydrogenase-like [Copidosoma floridanum]XP_014206078.1 farnesol dehydrogenase-like [Copidosoma floridanum]XP_014206085.1 farnesol dehydrogenase-like [Copidosoma floridanum]XP_014206093.1 farnesol dehydrogenase-like [Copidosoma floridanum]XP_014206101.1 farnesol dehydrogenase-like [Copidosoma floridanum]XP_014206108.1 farnesol dehydrogenase-like [Copidosoma floridanum]XP_014206116.1 farnesol dehydrogenase-like [Copidosoma floridanum]XP_014206126.1 farnesol dehydrogenase-like [Co